MTALRTAYPLTVVKAEFEPISLRPSQDSSRIELLRRNLAELQDELRLSAAQWEEERGWILEETEYLVREEDQANAELRTENERLKQAVRLAISESDVDIPERSPHLQMPQPQTSVPRPPKNGAASDSHSEDIVDDIEVLGCISVKGNDAQGNPIKFRQVILTKPEDGDMLWDLRRLRLGPTMEVMDPRHRKTFTRRMLSRAFGGGFQETYHHSRQPNHPDWYATYNPTWNPQLPDVGQQGVAFDDVHTDRLLPVFILVRTNAWRYCGHYSVTMWGELDAVQIARLPRDCLDTMVHDYAHLKNGQRAVDGREAKNMKEARGKGVPYRPIVRTEEGIMEAFLDGRMVQLFTILQFHHHDKVWFERLLAVEPAVAEEEKVIAQKKKEKEEEKKRLKEAGKKEAEVGTKRKTTNTGAGGNKSRKKRKAKAKRKVSAEDESDSDIEFIDRSVPTESGRRSQRINTSSSERVSRILQELDEEEEDEGEDEDEDDTESEAESDEGF
ncbi:uncharacterized protein SCHCODRAFT_02497067 [Schizophyllum commune H4-8]|uniref:uncharacterized protein n=1 Tax=Schizophyllum commune (strain H4-8 / FGSC 9210) TaxID=578458 RepID=UPI00215F4D7F|nr:uncharacterized protein SCHCODRAFT_02497067 [Schizophyllum commune H4-8]KAI5895611.1 hypothetical protein SCHCODRAFT_02497067 [Schizophyllum commune H4-8]